MLLLETSMTEREIILAKALYGTLVRHGVINTEAPASVPYLLMAAPSDEDLDLILVAKTQIEETVSEVVAEIEKHIHETGNEGVLDDVIHDEHAELAAAFNNDGLESQVRQLLSHGYDRDAILTSAGISTTVNTMEKTAQEFSAMEP